MWNGPTFDCQQCGACCADHGVRGGSSYVSLTKDETKRMKRFGLTVVQTQVGAYLGTRAYAGEEASVICVGFRGAIGTTCGCGVYEGRPNACRIFEVGSTACRAARRDAGLTEMLPP